jgi:predicted ABC-type ATPase
VADARSAPVLYVLAGVNGSGKSSIGGATIRRRGADYFNPDEAARAIRAADPSLSQADANAAAWHEGKRLLLRAIAERKSHAFETTLGGETITGLLEKAAEAGIEVRVWYVGLASPALHVARVRARVAKGGHDIPEDVIRARYDQSRAHLVRLMPRLTELRVFDNSAPARPLPAPALVLHVRQGAIVSICPLTRTPAWAKPIVARALSRGIA